MRHALHIPVLLLLLVPSAHAAAQCAEGRVANEQTSGRCCWPGQSWNDAAARCEGPPQCPGGWVGEGDTCVRNAPPAPAPAAVPQPVYGAPIAPMGAAVMPGAPMQMQTREVSEPRVGLAVTGGIFLGVAYVYSVVVGSIFIGSCSPANSWAMYIPIAGGFAWAGIDDGYCGYGSYSSSSNAGAYFGIPGSGVQVIGLTLLLVGIIARRTRRVPAYAELAPELVAGPGDAGLALQWDF